MRLIFAYQEYKSILLYAKKEIIYMFIYVQLK